MGPSSLRPFVVGLSLLAACSSSHAGDGDGGRPDVGGDTHRPDASRDGPSHDGANDGAAQCGPMDARGEGACRAILGFVWDGVACVSIGGCNCVGSDCDRLMGEVECLMAFRGCGSGGCETDRDCEAGAEWCVQSACVECDNSGRVCDLLCPFEWRTYSRNGCDPCDCAPQNQCDSDAECDAGKCFAGAFCWDWCPAGDPSCCFGNLCSTPGCEEPPPVGCSARGCPLGQECSQTGCASSGCGCDPGSGSWVCTDDCGGGECVRR